MKNIKKALELKMQLDKLRPIKPEFEARIMQKFRLDWNFHSNNLEGNSLTYGETRALLLYGITAQGKPLKDHFEINGHDEAIKWIEEVAKGDFSLTETFIRQLHQLILKENYWTKAQTVDDKETQTLIEVGKYKTQPNNVKTITGEMFYFAEPIEVPFKMQELLKWFIEKELEKDINPIELAAIFHHRFILIHPFGDGNGRLVRILMNLTLMKFGYPPVIIKTADKISYFAALSQADVGEIEVFIEYIAKNLVHSLELMIKGASGDNIEESTDFDKKLALLEQKLKARGKAEITKSKEVILELFDDSIVRLQQRFYAECQKFNRFYHGGKSLMPANRDQLQSDLQQLKENTLKISNKQSFITFFYQFNIFLFDKVKEFNYKSSIRIIFNLKDYVIKVLDLDKELLTKPYSEQLTDEEIEDVVKSISEAHLNFIEKQLAEKN